MTKTEKAIEKALSLVGQGYIYGAKGQTCSPAFRQQQAEQYPEQADHILGEGEKWDGVPVWDCAQLTRAVAKAGGVSLVSGATSQWVKTDWAAKGPIETLPQGTPAFVYRRQRGSDSVMAHTGVCLGDGTCVHARGTAYGVVHQRMDEHAWTHWATVAWPEGGSDMLYETIASAPNGGSINMRAAPDKAAVRVGVVTSGSTVGVLTVGEGWSLVEYNGVTGWMMNEFLGRLPEASPGFEEQVLGKLDEIITLLKGGAG